LESRFKITKENVQQL